MSSEDFDRQPADALRNEDVQPGKAQTDLAAALAAKEEQANKQRQILFYFVLSVVVAMLTAVVVAVCGLGMRCLDLDTPVAVAFISAASIQSFILVGLLARGLYETAKKATANGQE